MAVVWGAWGTYGGGERLRIGREVTVAPPKPTSANASVDATSKWWVQFATVVGGGSRSLTLFANGGAISATHMVTVAAVVGPPVVVVDRTDPIALVWGETQPKSFWVDVVGGSYGSAPNPPLHVRPGPVTIPARPFELPAAPTSVVATRVSNAQQTLAWTRHHSAPEAPYQSQRVFRREYGGESFLPPLEPIKTLSGTAASYTDATTVANRRYEYRIQAINSTGATASATSNAVFTTPSAPSNVQCVKNAAGDIVVEWTPGYEAYVHREYRVEHSTDNGATWSQIGVVAHGTYTYTHVAPDPADTHRYRVRCATTGGTQGVLYSGYATGQQMSIAEPPNAPTLLKPNGVASRWSGYDSIWLSWRHNPTDFSEQTKSEVRYREVGAGSWFDAEDNTPAQEWDAHGDFGTNFAGGETVEWQVRTWGAHATASPWSALATTVLAVPPLVEIEHPTGLEVYDTTTLFASWTYHQEQASPQAGWRAWLFDHATGELLETRTGNGDTAEVTFDHRGVNGGAYRVEVQALSAEGAWSDVVNHTAWCELVPPEDIDITAVWDELLGHVVLTLTPLGAVSDESYPAISVDVERCTDGGAWVTVATGLEPGTVLADTTASTLGSHEYRVVATTEAGGAGVAGTVTFEPGEERWGYLSVGPGFGTVVRFFGNIKVTDAGDVASALHHFARGGDGVNFPVALMSKNASQAIGVSATIESMSSTPAEFMAIAHTPSTALLRLPDGTRVFGVLKGVSRSQEYRPFAEVSFTVERTATTVAP